MRGSLGMSCANRPPGSQASISALQPPAAESDNRRSEAHQEGKRNPDQEQ